LQKIYQWTVELELLILQQLQIAFMLTPHRFIAAYQYRVEEFI
jgi:hypothetical protein